MDVKVGQIWAENDPRSSRRVRVLAVDGYRVQIVSVEARPDRRKNPARWTSLTRFCGGTARGFSLVEDAP